MGNLMKALCITLLFFAYSFGLLGAGMIFEKRIIDIEKAESEMTQQKMNVNKALDAEEYHKYYQIVVSRIITSEFEGLDKEAIKTYIKGYDERFNKLADLFYPKREEDPGYYGTSFPMMFAGLKRAFDENELNMYKEIILNTSMATSDEDVELIFKNPAEDSIQNSNNAKEPSNAASSVEEQAKRALEEAGDISENQRAEYTESGAQPQY